MFHTICSELVYALVLVVAFVSFVGEMGQRQHKCVLLNSLVLLQALAVIKGNPHKQVATLLCQNVTVRWQNFAPGSH